MDVWSVNFRITLYKLIRKVYCEVFPVRYRFIYTPWEVFLKHADRGIFGANLPIGHHHIRGGFINYVDNQGEWGVRAPSPLTPQTSTLLHKEGRRVDQIISSKSVNVIYECPLLSIKLPFFHLLRFRAPKISCTYL